MHSIDVDFEVWKALTAMRISEKHSYNDVLRSLLELESTLERVADPASPLSAELAVPATISQLAEFSRPKGGFYSRDLFLPDGTALRAIYKGVRYNAAISNSQWLDQDRQIQSSPSAAAKAITGNNVN